MSRTFRMKKIKRFRPWMDREEFDRLRDLYIQGCPKPVIPEAPKCLRPWQFDDWMSTSKQKLAAQKAWDEWYAHFYTKEYTDYKDAARFSKYSFGKLEYSEFLKAFATWRRSDGAYKSMNHGPHWYVNLYLERPLRRKHKQQVHHAIRNEPDFEASLEPRRRSGAYYW